MVGLFVAILLIIVGAVIAKKRWFSQKKNPNLKTSEKSNQDRINSTMVLNDQAANLSYNGKHEIEESKFKIGKKIGGGGPNLKTLETLIEEDPMVDLFDRKFPQSTVKAWKDITLERKLGSGQFGKVYKGFLHLGKYTR